MKEKISLLTVFFFVAATLLGCNPTKIIFRNYSDIWRGNIEGKAVYADSGLPASDVWIHVTGTSIAGMVDSSGVFLLQDLPVGNYDIQFSGNQIRDTLVGIDFTDKERANLLEIELRRQTTSAIDQHQSISDQKTEIKPILQKVLSLSKQIVELENSRSESLSNSYPEDEKDYLQLFEDYFVGSSRYPGCTLLNRGEIQFVEDSQSNIVMKLRSPVTLKVMNRNLGYYVELDLENFRLATDLIGYKTTYSGEAYFYNLYPDHLQPPESIQTSRKEEFFGSFKHFLVAASQSKPLDHSGFRLFSGQSRITSTSLGSSYAKVYDVEISPEELVSSTNNSDLKMLSSEQVIRVVYTHKRVNKKSEYAGSKRGLFPESWIQLRTSPVWFTSNGNLLNKADEENIMLSGYWNSQTVCQMLPDDYRP